MRIDFNQGLDARLIDKPIAKLLARCKWIRFIRLSCDTEAMIPVVEKAVNNLKNNGISGERLFVYTLVQNVEESHKRIEALRKMGVVPFAQPYRDFEGGEPTKEQKRLAGWCNRKAIFKTVAWEDYR